MLGGRTMPSESCQLGSVVGAALAIRLPDFFVFSFSFVFVLGGGRVSGCCARAGGMAASSFRRGTSSRLPQGAFTSIGAGAGEKVGEGVARIS